MPPTILIVDNELAVAQLAARMLAAEGYRTLTTASACLALELAAATGPIDLLVADVRMPERNGFDLADAIRGHRPELPVLFVSGFVEPDYGGEGGFQDFLAKPFSQAELVTAVRRLLG